MKWVLVLLASLTIFIDIPAGIGYEGANTPVRIHWL